MRALDVARFVAGHPQVEMVATNRVMFLEAGGEMSDTHALRRMFNVNPNREENSKWIDGSSMHSSRWPLQASPP